MSFRPLLAGLVAAGVIGLVGGRPVQGQAVDPAVVGERLQRLTATMESLEMALASQKRQIDSLSSELLKLRDEVQNQSHARPWAEDMKRLADGIAEVDRKRASDSEQVVRVLGDLRKSVAALAEAPPARSAPVEREDKGRRGGGAAPARSGGEDPGKEITASKAVPHVLERGQSLSEVVTSFNEQAKKQGYQPLTVDMVMKFNKITDARRVPAGMTLQLPLIPKQER